MWVLAIASMPAVTADIEYSRSFTGSEVADGYGGEKLPQTDSTLKDLDTEDIGTCIGVLESANSQDHRNPTWAGDESHIREKDVPSHGPRKEHMGELIFGAGLELIVGVDLRAFEGLNCDLRRGEERITWNPGINHHPSERKGNPGLNSFIKSIMNSNHVFQHFRPNDDQHERRGVQRRVWDPGITRGYILKQHLEDKVLPEAAPLRRTEPDEARPISSEFQIEVVRKASKKVQFYNEMDINTFMKL
ncbi:hypothetical protein Tco_0355246 [Tanacetum coccineum]